MTDVYLDLNKEQLRALIKHIVDTQAVPRMERVAHACNAELGAMPGQKGYMVSIQGDKPLTKHDYRATVITASAKAIYHNAKTNALVKLFHLAGGDL